MNRRSMLAGIATAGACSLIDAQAWAATRRPFFQRVGLPVGLQLYTLGDDAGRDLDATFAQVAAIGYRDIELPQLYGRSAADIRAAADKAGLKISSLHVMPFGAGMTFNSPAAQIAETLGALGAKRAVLPIMAPPSNAKPNPGEDFIAALGRALREAGESTWKDTANLLNRQGAALKPLGFGVAYHNHNIEFAPVGKTTGWDILVKETNPALVSFEVDIGWVVAAGRDPVALLRSMRGRTTQLHVKDMTATPANFAFSMKPAEIGSGTLDWAKILPAAYEAGVRHFYVEQEPPFTIPRIEAVRKSYDFLAKVRA